MTDGVRELIKALQLAAAGNSVSMDHVRSLNLGSTDDAIEKAATQSWRRLKNFIDDQDIRSRDSAYDGQLKQEMMWRAQELTSLLSEKAQNKKAN